MPKNIKWPALVWRARSPGASFVRGRNVIFFPAADASSHFSKTPTQGRMAAFINRARTEKIYCVDLVKFVIVAQIHSVKIPEIS
jgi:hypothetical protein